MATQRRIALAFAGSGKTSEENIKALLNDYLGFGPEDEDGYPALPDEADLDVRIAIPLSESHLTEGLEGIIDWIDYADLAYEVHACSPPDSRKSRTIMKNAETTHDSKNANEAIISWLYEHGRDGFEPVLILLWGEEGDENAEILLDRSGAFDHFKALDITAGLDELNFGDEEANIVAPEPEAVPEPEPEEEPKRARGSRRRKAEPLEVEETPLEDKAPEPEAAPEPEKVEPEPEKPARRRRAAAKPVEEPAEVPEPANEEVQHDVAAAVREQEVDKTLREAILTRAVTFRAAVDSLPDGRLKSLGITRLEEAVYWISRAVEEETPQEAAGEPSRGRGRPRKDGSPAQPRTAADKGVTEYLDADSGEWVRRGRGRLPKGVQTRVVDPETGEPIDE